MPAHIKKEGTGLECHPFATANELMDQAVNGC